jgi:hypothetical protein
VGNLQTFKPSHGQNRMGHEGDVTGAHEYYLSGKNRNLISMKFTKRTLIFSFELRNRVNADH